jgi:hypothetical protein
MCLTCAGPCCSCPTLVLDIIILDTTRGDLVEISSSSYGLSLFLKAGPHHDEIKLREFWLHQEVVLGAPREIKLCKLL